MWASYAEQNAATQWITSKRTTDVDRYESWRSTFEARQPVVQGFSYGSSSAVYRRSCYVCVLNENRIEKKKKNRTDRNTTSTTLSPRCRVREGLYVGEKLRHERLSECLRDTHDGWLTHKIRCVRVLIWRRVIVGLEIVRVALEYHAQTQRKDLAHERCTLSHECGILSHICTSVSTQAFSLRVQGFRSRNASFHLQLASCCFCKYLIRRRRSINFVKLSWASTSFPLFKASETTASIAGMKGMNLLLSLWFASRGEHPEQHVQTRSIHRLSVTQSDFHEREVRDMWNHDIHSILTNLT